MRLETIEEDLLKIVLIISLCRRSKEEGERDRIFRNGEQRKTLIRGFKLL